VQYRWKTLILILITCGVAVTMMTLRGLGQDASSKKRMTEKQKQHSKLYKEFESRNSQKISKLVTAGSGDVNITIQAEGEVGSEYAPPFELSTFLRGAVCDADAVVIGNVRSKDSQLTEGETFIFTDYELTVEKVLKDNAKAPISPDSTITVTRPGGEVQINSRKVTAVSEYHEPLSIGERYILFLRFIPGTGAYKADNNRGSFQLRNNQIITLTKESLPKQLQSGNNAQSFINQVSLASTTCDNK
jgi:hypothetical protein